MAKDIRFEMMPEMTGKVSQKYSRISFRRGVSGEVHTYCYQSDHNQHQSELQKQHSATFGERMARAKAIMDDPAQRAEWQELFDMARRKGKTKYHRVQQFIAFNVEVE